MFVGDWSVVNAHLKRVTASMEAGRFAYKSIRIQVDSHTSRFAYIKVVSPTRPWSIHIHRSRFAYIERKNVLINTLTR